MSDMVITQEQAQKIVEADFANLLKRVQGGKPLTAAQMQRVRAMSGEVKPTAKSLTELAGILGYHRNHLTKLEKKDDAPKPSANGERDVSAWRQYLAKHGRKKTDDVGDVMLREKARQVILKNDDLQFTNDLRRGKYLVRDDVKVEVARMTQAFRKSAEGLKKSLPTQLKGLDEAGMFEVLDRAVEEMLQKLHSDSWT